MALIEPQGLGRQRGSWNDRQEDDWDDTIYL